MIARIRSAEVAGGNSAPGRRPNDPGLITSARQNHASHAAETTNTPSVNASSKPEPSAEDACALAAPGRPTIRAMASILDEIVAHKGLEVAERKALSTPADLERSASEQPEPRGFVRSLTAPLGDLRASIIAEIKRRSPSAGWIRESYRPGADGSDAFAPEGIARRYHEAGARAISCLTDEKYFGGDLSYLERVRSAMPLPVLRKDFMIDPWQILESRAAGADAILLIAECLTDHEITQMLDLTLQLGMDALVESHDHQNLLRCVALTRDVPPARVLLGVNNRDLRVMKTDLGHTLRMKDQVPDPGCLVSESGIRTSKDLDRLGEGGVRIALVGEHLMAQNDPGAALSVLLGI